MMQRTIPCPVFLLRQSDLSTGQSQRGCPGCSSRGRWPCSGDFLQGLEILQEITIEDQGTTLMIRSECLGTCGKIFQAIDVAIPPTIRKARA